MPKTKPPPLPQLRCKVCLSESCCSMVTGRRITMEDFTKQDEAYRAYQKGFAAGVKSVADNNVGDKQTREKLIDLFKHDDCPLFMVFGDNMDALADFLIANGVTVLTPDEARNIYTVQELEELQGEAYDLGVESVLRNHYGLSWHDAEKVRKEVSKLQSVSKWIPVTERLPEYRQIVAVCVHFPFDENARMAVAPYTPEIQPMFWERVTHWMPLPEPPKGE